MDRTMPLKLLPAVLASIIGIAALGFSTTSYAATVITKTAQPYTQVAHYQGNYYPRGNIYIGGYPRGYIYFGGGYYKNPAWGGYRTYYPTFNNYNYYNCQRRCLVDRWTGRVISCEKVCY